MRGLKTESGGNLSPKVLSKSPSFERQKPLSLAHANQLQVDIHIISTTEETPGKIQLRSPATKTVETYLFVLVVVTTSLSSSAHTGQVKPC